MQTYLLITLLAANTPHKATETALLAPEITFVFELPHFGHFTDVSIGSPQFGHAKALFDTSLPHPGHFINDIINLLRIYRIGIFILYQCGIIMSRGEFMRLREIRKAKGISQLKLAIDLNTNQNTISRYETGEREPGIVELIKIADYFNVSVDYLIERTDNPHVQK